MIPKVTVLLNDPRIRTPSEHDRRSDLIAIEKLHSAFSSLLSFRFRYVNEHKELLKELSKSVPRFVLNLCDGFRNQPAMQAHIPSLLDILGVPYSGSGPRCITICRDSALLRAYLADAIAPDTGAGLRLPRVQNESRYIVGLVGNIATGLDILPILEPDGSAVPSASAKIRYLAESNRLQTWPRYRRAALSRDACRSIRLLAIDVFDRLGCRDYASITFGLDQNGWIGLQSVTPNPDWRWNSPLAQAAALGGTPYNVLLGSILKAGTDRTGSRTVPPARARISA